MTNIRDAFRCGTLLFSHSRFDRRMLWCRASAGTSELPIRKIRTPLTNRRKKDKPDKREKPQRDKDETPEPRGVPTVV